MGFLQLSNDTVSLVPVDQTFATEIFNANSGNVNANYFYKFDNIKDTKEWLKATLLLVNYGTKLSLCILSRNQEFLGLIDVNNLDTDLLEFRIWIEESNQKKGFGTQAGYLILDYINSNYPDKQLRYVTDTKNEASMALAKKLGLHVARTYKDESNKPTTVFVLKAINN